MNLGDVKLRVKRTFGDESGVQVTDDDITRWANDAITNIILNNEGIYEEIKTLDVVANQQDYAMPTDLLILKAINYQRSSATSYMHLEGYDLQKFNTWVNGWDGTNTYGPGIPAVYTVFKNTLKLFPIPDSSQPAGLKLFYNKLPTQLVNDTDVPVVPVIYHNAIVNYVLQMCYELDENFYFAQLKQGQVAQDIKMGRYRQELANQEFYPMITIKDEDAW